MPGGILYPFQVFDTKDTRVDLLVSAAGLFIMNEPEADYATSDVDGDHNEGQPDLDSDEHRETTICGYKLRRKDFPSAFSWVFAQMWMMFVMREFQSEDIPIEVARTMTHEEREEELSWKGLIIRQSKWSKDQGTGQMKCVFNVKGCPLNKERFQKDSAVWISRVVEGSDVPDYWKHALIITDVDRTHLFFAENSQLPPDIEEGSWRVEGVQDPWQMYKVLEVIRDFAMKKDDPLQKLIVEDPVYAERSEEEQITLLEMREKPIQSREIHSIMMEQGLNEAQRSAVWRALDNRVSLIHGPPGTGKSQTVVCLIKIFHRARKQCLLTAPSNKAVDAVTLRAMRDVPEIKQYLARFMSWTNFNKLADDEKELWKGTDCLVRYVFQFFIIYIYI